MDNMGLLPWRRTLRDCHVSGDADLIGQLQNQGHEMLLSLLLQYATTTLQFESCSAPTTLQFDSCSAPTTLQCAQFQLCNHATVRAFTTLSTRHSLCNYSVVKTLQFTQLQRRNHATTVSKSVKGEWVEAQVGESVSTLWMTQLQHRSNVILHVSPAPIHFVVILLFPSEGHISHQYHRNAYSCQSSKYQKQDNTSIWKHFIDFGCKCNTEAQAGSSLPCSNQTINTVTVLALFSAVSIHLYNTDHIPSKSARSSMLIHACVPPSQFSSVPTH